MGPKCLLSENEVTNTTSLTSTVISLKTCEMQKHASNLSVTWMNENLHRYPNPHVYLDPLSNWTVFSLTHAPNLLRYWQKNKRQWKHNLLGGGKRDVLIKALESKEPWNHLSLKASLRKTVHCIQTSSFHLLRVVSTSLHVVAFQSE